MSNYFDMDTEMERWAERMIEKLEKPAPKKRGGSLSDQELARVSAG